MSRDDPTHRRRVPLGSSVRSKTGHLHTNDSVSRCLHSLVHGSETKVLGRRGVFTVVGVDLVLPKLVNAVGVRGPSPRCFSEPRTGVSCHSEYTERCDVPGPTRPSPTLRPVPRPSLPPSVPPLPSTDLVFFRFPWVDQEPGVPGRGYEDEREEGPISFQCLFSVPSSRVVVLFVVVDKGSGYLYEVMVRSSLPTLLPDPTLPSPSSTVDTTTLISLLYHGLGGGDRSGR